MKASSKKKYKKRPSKPKTPDDFVSVARRLGTDEDKERFEKNLGKIAKVKTGRKNG